MASLRRAAVATLLLLLAPSVYADGLDAVREKGVLRVALYDDFFPYSYLRDGRMQGLDADLARALAERLGVGLSVMKLASDESMSDDLRNAVWKGHYLGGGTADVMLHVPVDPRFAAENDRVAIFAPYLREEVMIAHRLERIPTLDSLAPFEQQPIGVELETIGDMFLARAENGRINPQTRRYRYFDLACEALLGGEVAALMAPRAQLEGCLQNRDGYAVARAPVRVGLFTWVVGLAVKADSERLRQALAEALRELRAEGELEQLFVRHGLSYTPPATD